VSLPGLSGNWDGPYSGVIKLRAFGPRVVLVAWMENANSRGHDLLQRLMPAVPGGRLTPGLPESMDAWAIVNGQTWLGFTTATDSRASEDHRGLGRHVGDRDPEASPTGNTVLAVSFVSATDGWAIFQIPGREAARAGAICEGSPLGSARASWPRLMTAE